MKLEIEYSEAKNEILKNTRGICFEDVVKIIEAQGYIGIIKHKNKLKYMHQHILIVEINNYIYAVPFIWRIVNQVAFLKTLYPDRNLTKIYLKK